MASTSTTQTLERLPEPTGDKLLRKEDHQAFPLQVIFEMKGGDPHILSTIPGDKTLFPPACKFT